MNENKLGAPRKKQSMRGFDDEFTNIVDYILRITYRIWEQRQIGTIYRYYSDDCLIHTPGGEVQGVEKVVANTVQTLSVFPDRQLYGDDVIWGGNDEEGFYSSHRITSTATHTGYSSYGPPTGKKLRFLGVADCLVKDNQVVEEWLVRDNLSIIQQIGLDVEAYVAMLAKSAPLSTTTNEEMMSRELLTSELPPSQLEGFDPEDFVKRTWHEVWNRRMFDVIFENYARTFQCHSSAGRELYGNEEQIQFAIDWLACFPDGGLTFDHFCYQGNEESGYRTALRYTFTGTHTGYGIYGLPTGKPVKIMGISHATIKDGKFVEEWHVFDELNLLVQLYVSEDEETAEIETDLEEGE